MLSLFFVISGGAALSLHAADKENAKVHVVSSHLGLMFAPDDKLDLGVRLEGSLRAGKLDYAIEQRGGTWHEAGEIKTPAVANGKTEVAPLPLSLPEPGLYHLHIKGSLSGKVAIDRNIAVLSAPPAVDVNSPWGIFFTPPAWYDPTNPKAANEVARSLRALGASWVRFGFWEDSYGRVTVTPSGPNGKNEVHLSPTLWKDYARELHAQKLYLMGNLASVPRALSSQPNNLETLGDGGPGYGHVAPKDYALWEQFIEQLGQTFKDEVSMWEIWNEPDNQGTYWRGTIDELAEVIHHTSAAFRRVSPGVKIAASGFTVDRRAHDWMKRLIELGCAKDLDVFTVHYTDTEAVSIDRWRTIEREKAVSLPLWNSEERSSVPIFNLEHGIPVTFKFLHVNIGYDDSPLVEKDYTLRPSGMAFATGARCLGAAHFLKSQVIPGGMVHLFQRGAEVVGVVQRDPLGVFLEGQKPMELTLAARALDGARPITQTTELGRISKVQLDEKNLLHLTMREPLVFINGCAALDLVPEQNSTRDYVVAEAESAKAVGDWESIERRDASGQRVMELWNAAVGPGKIYSLDFPLTVSTAGKYDVLIAGGSLAGLKPPRSVSPFVWGIDDQKPARVEMPPSVEPGSDAILNGLNRLGTLAVTAGNHVFHLRVESPIDGIPVARLTLDAVVLRPAKK